ncbi:TetR/AcrR family transcriptional regulator [Streptosporangium sp. CA-135522]|uniref:TetR/AcrR family transcriptional regulator n=1 Tax=Streptosporangium sp. CA-135522 TaxID=3240072 RepID=UPI003D8BDAB6
MTLRQRNRLAAVRQIMDTAMDLFDQHGYTEVTVEQIAAAAGVSPRTFYRYFGTKEGLFTTDPLAAVGLGLMDERIAPDDLPGSIRRIIEDIHTTSTLSEGTPWRGMRYVIEEPAVRAAVYTALDDASERLASLLRSKGADPAQARVTARAYWFGVYFGALEQWHLDGRTRPLAHYVQEGLSVLRNGESMRR